MDTINAWIEEQIKEESSLVERKIRDQEDITPSNFIQSYLVEMRTNNDFDSEEFEECYFNDFNKAFTL